MFVQLDIGCQVRFLCFSSSHSNIECSQNLRAYQEHTHSLWSTDNTAAKPKTAQNQQCVYLAITTTFRFTTANLSWSIKLTKNNSQLNKIQKLKH